MRWPFCSVYLAVLALFVGLGLSSVSHAETIQVSNFKTEYQGDAPWCWGAVARMALYQGANIRKSTCELISEVLGQNCCSIFSSPSCLVGGRVEKVFEKNGFNTNRITADVQRLIEIIKNDQLAILELLNRKPGELGHYSVVYGIENVDQPEKLRLLIYDPKVGKMKRSPGDLRKSYHHMFKSLYWNAILTLD